MPGLSAAESFWSTFKTEFYDRHHWATKTEAKMASGRWIEERYNRTRRSELDYMTPTEYEHKYYRENNPRPQPQPGELALH